MHVPSWLSVKRRDVTCGALGFVVEDRGASNSRCLVKVRRQWSWRGNGQLIKMQRGEFRGDQIDGWSNVAVSMFGCQWKGRGIIQSWVPKRPLTVHFKIGDEPV